MKDTNGFELFSRNTIKGSAFMTPAWKLRRELARVGQQLKGLVERLTDPIKQHRLDQEVAAGLPHTAGGVSQTGKIALFLVYQPEGISDSTLITCQWLIQAGYAPFVVSNAALDERDRKRLVEVVWRLAERPNFGYDFGGYRDALTCLAQWQVVPQEMLILNDSVWLPLQTNTDLLDRLSAHPADVVGTILRTRGTEQFLESYLFRLRPSAFTHPGFKAYWKQLRLTSNKYHVIRRGERGFSGAMQAAGLHVFGLFDSGDSGELQSLLEQQDESFLRKMLQYAAYVDAPFAAERDQLLSRAGCDWRDQALQHAKRVLQKRLAYSTFPYAMVQLMSYPLLKKSAEPVSKAWRIAYIAAVRAGDLSKPAEPVWSEICARDVKP